MVYYNLTSLFLTFLRGLVITLSEEQTLWVRAKRNFVTHSRNETRIFQFVDSSPVSPFYISVGFSRLRLFVREVINDIETQIREWEKKTTQQPT
jgi:hypothetical protein